MTLEVRGVRLVVTAVEPGSAAAGAGLLPLDTILVVNDLSLVDVDPIPPEKVLEIFRRGPTDPSAINRKRSSEFRIVVGRGAGTLTVHLKPSPDDHRGPEPGGSAAGPPLPGSEAPLFSGRDLKEEEVSLRSLRGRPVLIDFWASWCVPCRQSAITLRRLADEHAGRLVVIGVSLDDDRRACEAFVYNHHLPGHQICDGGRNGPIGRLYGVGSSGIPFSVLVDEAGRVAAAGGSLQEMEEAVARLTASTGSRPGA
jgi:cytochrome c biogenesis protein CcmG/thiol:disulfide interchange protein DsbE